MTTWLSVAHLHNRDTFGLQRIYSIWYSREYKNIRYGTLFQTINLSRKSMNLTPHRDYKSFKLITFHTTIQVIGCFS